MPSDPTSVTSVNLKAWYKADALTGLSDGSSVSNWPDSSGNGNTLTLRTGTFIGPLYRPSPTPSGLPAVEFGATGYVGLGAVFTLAQPEWVVIVAKLTSSNTTQRLLDGGTLNSMTLFEYPSSGMIQQYVGGAGASGTLGTSAFRTIESYFSGASSTLVIDGGTASTGTVGTTAAGGVTLGNQAEAGASGHFQICEVCVYDGKPSGAEIANLRTYLDRWTTADTSPAFAASPPSLGAGTSGNTVTLTGTNTVWTVGTTFSVASTGTGASITAQSVNATTQVATLTVTAGTAGTLTYSDGTDSATATQSVTPGQVNATDTHLFFSPYNWDSDGGGAMQSNNVKASSTFARTACPGAYLKIAATSAGSGTVTLNLDTTPLSGVTTANCPRLAWSVDGGAMQTTLLAYSASPVSLSLATGLASGSHTVIVWFQGVVLNGQTSMGDRWNDPTTGASFVKVTGVTLDAGSSIASPTLRSKRMLGYGDSITEGADAVGSGNGAGDQDATQTYALLMAQAFGAEVGIVGNSYQGYEAVGSGNYPNLASAWDKHSAGRSRLVSGLFSPAPDYILSDHGTNGSTSAGDITSLAMAWRTAAPSAKILFAVPYGQAAASAITSGVTTARATDSGVYLLDAGMSLLTGLTSNDGIHPNTRGHAQYGAVLTQRGQAAIGGNTGGGGTGGGDLSAQFAAAEAAALAELAAMTQVSVTTRLPFGTGNPLTVFYKGFPQYVNLGTTQTVPQFVADALTAQGLRTA